MEARQFHLGDILSITTGYLVSPRHIGGVYDILNFMTGDNLFTHALPRASRECEGPLREMYPWLRAVVVPAEFTGTAHVEKWLAEQVATYGEMFDVYPLRHEEHTVIDPLAELAMMRPDLPVIPIVIDTETVEEGR